MSSLHTAYLGIGANLGDARENVIAALTALREHASIETIDASSLFKTAPVDASGDDYCNAVARIATRMTPHELLACLQAIERDHGRQRPYRNAPRTLDLDILLYDQCELNDTELTIPHPRMTQRAFVLIPLLQLDPMIVIPGLGPAHQFVPAVSDQAITRCA